MQPKPARPAYRRLLAILVHTYTASGSLAALAAAVCISQGEIRSAFIVLFIAVLIDATDGSLARAAAVQQHTPWLDGRRLDDIVDYLNYTFLPIFLIWKLDWLPPPVGLWCGLPLVASLFAFSHAGAKDEKEGFFRGFPSYWNIVALYLAVLITPRSAWWGAGTLAFLSVLSVSPVHFVYPNRPPCWKLFFLGGAVLWGIVLLFMLWHFPDVPIWLTGVSLIYPAFYTAASLWLSGRSRLPQ